MNRSELIERLEKKNNGKIKAPEIEKTVKLVFERISLCLEKGERVEIRGFGSFSLHRHEKRTGRNPSTGEVVSVPEKTTPHFRAGKELRHKINK